MVIIYVFRNVKNDLFSIYYDYILSTDTRMKRVVLGS